MRRFQWRLQRVLEIKQKQEQVKRAELEAVTKQLHQAMEELDKQQEIVQALIDELSQKKSQERLADQPLYMQRLTANDKVIKQLHIEIENLQQARQEKMEETLKLKQLNEGLEKMRQRAEEEFMKEQEQLIQKELDDAAAIRFARGTGQLNKQAAV